jgi:hypothetical protein
MFNEPEEGGFGSRKGPVEFPFLFYEKYYLVDRLSSPLDQDPFVGRKTE